MVQAIKGAVPYPVIKQRYKVRIILYGKWDTKKGEPLERNCDNVVKSLFDAMAEAFGFGINGKGDNWLDRSYSVEAIHSDRELAEVTMWMM